MRDARVTLSTTKDGRFPHSHGKIDQVAKISRDCRFLSIRVIPPDADCYPYWRRDTHTRVVTVPRNGNSENQRESRADVKRRTATRRQSRCLGQARSCLYRYKKRVHSVSHFERSHAQKALGSPIERGVFQQVTR